MKKTKIQNDQMFMLEDEEYNNDIIPSMRTEMWRKIDLKGDVQIAGGIYGKTLEIYPHFIYIRDAIFILEHIKVSGKHSGKVWFNSVVNTDHSLLVENSQVYSRFSADLRAEYLNIENVVIYGNVFCKNALIKNSVIMGSVFVDNEMTVENSILGSFQTKEIKIPGKIGLIFPFAISSNFPIIESEIYYLLLSPFSNGKKYIDVISFINDDIQKIRSIDEKETHYICSPSMRIFDFKPYYNQVQKNIMTFFKLCENYDGSLNEKDDKLSEFEMHFFKLITNDFKSDPIKGKSKFFELPDSILKDLLPAPKDNLQLDEIKTDKSISEKTITKGNDESENAAKYNKELSNSNVGQVEHENVPTEDKLENNLEKVAEGKEKLDKKCPNCGNTIENPDHIFCEKCGIKLKE